MKRKSEFDQSQRPAGGLKGRFRTSGYHSDSSNGSGSATDVAGGGYCFSLFGNGGMGGNRNIVKDTSSSSNSNNNLSQLPRADPQASLGHHDEAKAAATLVQEMNALSMRERQKVNEDVHGIADKIEETPEFVAQSLQSLELEIRRIKQRPAYYKATFLRPGAFTSKDFMIHFLRAEEFHAKKAARRLVDYFEFKLDLFGLEKLCHPISYDDIGEEGQRYLQTGRVQMLGTDRIGRPILVAFSRRKAVYNDIRSVAKVFCYLFQVGLEFPDASKHGLVLILYDCGIKTDCTDEKEQFRQYRDMGFITLGAKMIACNPLALTAVHFCFDNSRLAAPMSAVQYIIGQRGRVRYRAHCGSITESLYALMSFGISTSNFPVSTDGAVQLGQFRQWLELRQKFEAERRANEQAKVGNFIIVPKINDVLLGRGRPYQEYPGNQRLADIVDQYWDRYQKSKMKEKQALTIEIVTMIQNEGFQFLKKDGGNKEALWVAVGNDKAREKVSHAFRNNTVLRKENTAAAAAVTVTPPASSSPQQPNMVGSTLPTEAPSPHQPLLSQDSFEAMLDSSGLMMDMLDMVPTEI